VEAANARTAPGCECCDKDLPPSATDAMICTSSARSAATASDNRLAGVLPELRRQFRAAASAACFKARKKSAIDAARFQSSGLRPNRALKLGRGFVTRSQSRIDASWTKAR